MELPAELFPSGLLEEGHSMIIDPENRHGAELLKK